MKSFVTIWLHLGIVFLIISCNSNPDQTDKKNSGKDSTTVETEVEALPKLTSVPSAKIVYQYREKGTLVRTDEIFFDEWGNRMVMNIKTTYDNKTFTWNKEEGHEFNHLRKTFSNLSKKPYYMRGIQRPASGKKLSDTVLIQGVPCEVFQSDVKMVKGDKKIEGYEKSWRYKGLEMKNETKGLPDPGDLKIKVATAFEEGITIDDQLFAIPKGYENAEKYKTPDRPEE